MKRNEAQEKKGEKVYYIDLTELYRVEVLRDFGRFLKGEGRFVTLPVAMKLARGGIASMGADAKEAARKAGIPESMYTPSSSRREK